MFGAPVEERFVNRAGSGRAPRAGRWIVLVLLCLAGFVVWALTFELEEVTRAQGRVVPSSQVQLVQTLEGGIIRDIRVRDGDQVAAGQVLFQIDATTFESQLGELQQQETALRAQQARLEAEAQGAAQLVFDPDLATETELLDSERLLFEARRAQLAQEIRILEGRLQRAEAEVAEQAASEARLRGVIAPLEEELALSEGLLQRGVMPELEVLRLRARLADERGTLAVTQASRAARVAAVDEAQRQIAAAQSAYRLGAQETLADVRTRLAVVRETLKSAQDRVSRTSLRAPVSGTVKSVAVSTLGSVVSPGATVAEIVAAEDGLRIEADIAPKDVAFIGPEARASVKITAYDYLIYGSLPATVERISADAFVDPEGRSFFRVDLRTDRAFVGESDAPLPIIPGMVATVDIQTGRKTVAAYLAKPLLRARAEALRER